MEFYTQFTSSSPTILFPHTTLLLAPTTCTLLPSPLKQYKASHGSQGGMPNQFEAGLCFSPLYQGWARYLTIGNRFKMPVHALVSASSSTARGLIIRSTYTAVTHMHGPTFLPYRLPSSLESMNFYELSPAVSVGFPIMTLCYPLAHIGPSPLQLYSWNLAQCLSVNLFICYRWSFWCVLGFVLQVFCWVFLHQCS